MWGEFKMTLDSVSARKYHSSDRVEMSIRDDLWQKENSKSEREYLQDGSETYHAVWFVDGGTDKKKTGED